MYRAVDRRSGAVVALKRLHRHLARDDAAIARLRRELDALRLLRHPSIVAARDLITWQRQPTIVMDFVAGEDLKARILRCGTLDPALTTRLARRLLDALATTHAAGIVHRDIKPQNIRLSTDLEVHLLDFGSARLDASSQLTATGTTVGTPEYMAPELFSASAYDPRVDLYGVGATLFECLTGHPPVAADSIAELAYQRATSDPPPVRSVMPDAPEGLAMMIDRCLQRTPEARFASAARALWALDHPEEERARAHRRSAMPPCLHCGTPLSRDATLCPQCRSERPFAFSPGAYTVTLTGASEAARFVEFIADRFPERARPRHLKAVAQAGLLAASVRPTLAADIAPAQARRLADDLKAIGVTTNVTARPPIGRRLIRPALLGLLTGLLLVLVTFTVASWAAILLIGVVSANFAVGALLLNEVRYASRPSGLLGDRRSRVPVASPTVRGIAITAAWAAILYMPLALAAGAKKAFVDDLYPAGWLALGAVLFAAVAATRTMTWGGQRIARRHDPMPRLRERLFVHPGRTDVARPSSADRALAGTVFMVGAFALVPLEVGILSLTPNPPEGVTYYDSDIRMEDGERASPETVAAGGDHSRPRDLVLSSVSQREKALQPAPPNLSRHAVWPVVVPAVLLAIVGGLWLALWRRKLQLSDDARSVLQQVERDRILRASRRVAPSDRRRGTPASVSTEDGFVGAALGYVTDLDSSLATDDAVRLWNAVEHLANHAAAHPRDPRSLEARCILEADTEQHLKFEFLRLAGELETRAAQRWLQGSLSLRTEDR